MSKSVLAVDRYTGYASLIKEANHFDEHPDGEGGDRFQLVELERPNLSMDEWFDYLPHPDGHGKTFRVPKVKFDTKHLRDKQFKVTSNLKNKVSREALKIIRVSDYLADYQAERTKYDTRENAILTTGTGKTFAAIQTNWDASNSGDTTFIFATAAGFYAESPVAPHSLNIAGMIANQGVIVQGSSGNGITISSTGSSITNIHSRGVGGQPTFAFLMSGPGNIISRCIASNVVQGFRLDTGPICFMSLVFDSQNGVFTTSNSATFSYITAVDCTVYGFRLNTVTSAICCRGYNPAATADFLTGGALVSGNNIDSDGSRPGSGGATQNTNTQFTNYAGDDFSLNSGIATSLSGVPVHQSDITSAALSKTLELTNKLWPGAFNPEPIVAAAAPGDPLFVSVTRSGLVLTVTVNGDDGATNTVKAIRRLTGAVVDTQVRLDDGAITITLDSFSATYDLLLHSSTGGGNSLCVLFPNGITVPALTGPNSPTTQNGQSPLDFIETLREQGETVDYTRSEQAVVQIQAMIQSVDEDKIYEENEQFVRLTAVVYITTLSTNVNAIVDPTPNDKIGFNGRTWSVRRIADEDGQVAKLEVFTITDQKRRKAPRVRSG